MAKSGKKGKIYYATQVTYSKQPLQLLCYVMYNAVSTLGVRARVAKLQSTVGAFLQGNTIGEEVVEPIPS